MMSSSEPHDKKRSRSILSRIFSRPRRYDFAGRVVLLTGASRGLGLVLARRFAKEGARLAICARDRNELLRAGQELGALGAELLEVACDLSDRAEVRSMVAAVLDHYGRIDVVINNAGTIGVGPVDMMRESDWERAMDLHFWAPLETMKTALPSMRARGNGRIVNISSIGGRIAFPHLLPYAASKFALGGLSEGLRSELAESGVKVTTVYPGLMRTGSPRNATFKGNHAAEYAWFAISDSLPFVSMSAERAARRIVEACREGRAELVLSIPAKLAVIARALFPGVTAWALAQVAKRLPKATNPDATMSRLGKDSTSKLAPSFLTLLSDRAAARNNELDPVKGHA